MKNRMSLWMRYIREKRLTILLYLSTVFLFVALGCLYHIENLEKLLYAFLMTLVLWGSAFVIQGMRYTGDCRQVARTMMVLQQNNAFPSEEIQALSKLLEQEGRTERAGTLEEEMWKMFAMLCENQQRERRSWEEQSMERRDYYMMWTHQIKTPIAAMTLLLENRQDKESFQLREELFKIEQYAEMALHFQRLEGMSQDMVIHECELNTLMKQAVKKFAVLFINSGVKLELCETDARVLTDGKWLSFCFEQIISNSIKYTKKGKIAVECEELEQCAALRITDTGIGIRQEDLPRIFEKGFTGYNGRMDKKATGIGLYLCRRICRQLGVELRAESSPDSGTRMELLIPKSEKGRL